MSRAPIVNTCMTKAEHDELVERTGRNATDQNLDHRRATRPSNATDLKDAS